MKVKMIEKIENDPNFDPNAKQAFQACKELVRKNTPGYEWEDKQVKVLAERIREFMEEGEYKMANENGCFKCVSHYNFVNVVEETPTYKIYRCDGGHHFAVVFKEFKTQDGENSNGLKLVYKNGQLVTESGTSRTMQFELED